jgi:hypothetical protein
MKELMENWRRYASEIENSGSHGGVDEGIPAVLATAGRVASKTGAVADRVGKVATGVKAGSDVVKKIVGYDEDDDELKEDELVFPSGSLDDDDIDDDDELDEWKAEDDHKYPSRKQRKRDKYMLKPEKGSWIHGSRELATGGLTKGYVGMSEAKKERKKQCFAYNPFHGKDGRFVDPEEEAGSYSMKSPDSSSPKDCTWGQARRSSANRSTQSTKRPCGSKGRWRCKDGSKKYEAKLRELEEFIASDITTEGKQEQLEAYLSGVISQELDRAIQKHMNSAGCNFSQFIRMLYAVNSAEKGRDTSSKN